MLRIKTGHNLEMFVMIVFLASIAHGQDFSGTYQGVGAEIQIVLNQNANAVVSGQMLANGGSYPIQGFVTDNVMLGSLALAGEQVHMGCAFENDVLYVMFTSDGTPLTAEPSPFRRMGHARSGNSPSNHARRSRATSMPGVSRSPLVGRWYRSTYRSTMGINSSFHQTMILAPSGDLAWVDQSVLSGSRRAGSASSGWTFSGIDESQINRGTWQPTQQGCSMTWQGGGETYRVHIQGTPGRREMLLTPMSGGEKELWTEYNN